jgi:DNA-binding transcriptional ArsR family regulator
MRAAASRPQSFRSIGNAHRLMILCLLMDGAKTVTEICDAVGARQNFVSQHLTRLRLDDVRYARSARAISSTIR